MSDPSNGIILDMFFLTEYECFAITTWLIGGLPSYLQNKTNISLHPNFSFYS